MFEESNMIKNQERLVRAANRLQNEKRIKSKVAFNNFKARLYKNPFSLELLNQFLSLPNELKELLPKLMRTTSLSLIKHYLNNHSVIEADKNERLYKLFQQILAPYQGHRKFASIVEDFNDCLPPALRPVIKQQPMLAVARCSLLLERRDYRDEGATNSIAVSIIEQDRSSVDFSQMRQFYKKFVISTPVDKKQLQAAETILKNGSPDSGKFNEGNEKYIEWLIAKHDETNHDHVMKEALAVASYSLVLNFIEKVDKYQFDKHKKDSLIELNKQLLLFYESNPRFYYLKKYFDISISEEEEAKELQKLTRDFFSNFNQSAEELCVNAEVVQTLQDQLNEQQDEVQILARWMCTITLCENFLQKYNRLEQNERKILFILYEDICKHYQEDLIFSEMQEKLYKKEIKLLSTEKINPLELCHIQVILVLINADLPSSEVTTPDQKSYDYLCGFIQTLCKDKKFNEIANIESLFSLYDQIWPRHYCKEGYTYLNEAYAYLKKHHAQESRGGAFKALHPQIQFNSTDMVFLNKLLESQRRAVIEQNDTKQAKAVRNEVLGVLTQFLESNHDNNMTINQLITLNNLYKKLCIPYQDDAAFKPLLEQLKLLNSAANPILAQGSPFFGSPEASKINIGQPDMVRSALVVTL